METLKPKSVFLVAVILAVLVASLMVASRLFQPIAWLTLPATWPGIFILGADETQERYGYWGELVLFWLCSLPCVVAYAWLLCGWWQRRKAVSSEETTCRHCGYDLRATPASCPECGTTVTSDAILSPRLRVLRRAYIATIVTAHCLALLSTWMPWGQMLGLHRRTVAELRGVGGRFIVTLVLLLSAVMLIVCLFRPAILNVLVVIALLSVVVMLLLLPAIAVP